MALSFVDQLETAIPHNYFGVELVYALDDLMQNKRDYAWEAYDLLYAWLVKMRELNASDIDFGGPGCENKIWMRIYGIKEPMKELGEFGLLESSCVILSCLTPNQKDALIANKNVDFSISLTERHGGLRFRGTAYFDNNYLAANFRRINDTLFSMEDLGIPPPVASRMNLKYEKEGLVLVTGITGSGKSTTLDAIIDMNNRENHAHIVIIGHPIEYVHQSKKSLVRHREVNLDVSSFSRGAIESLRQDPDIIVVGEMRDALTFSTVLEIADTGHKAFTTLHTSSAIDSIHRIVAEFSGDQQDRIRNRLADVLSVIMCQKLVPTVDGKLVMAKEILSVDSSVKAAIRNKNTGEIYQMIVEGRRYGMCTMEQDLFDLVKKGSITQKVAMSFSNNKKRMQQLLSVS